MKGRQLFGFILLSLGVTLILFAGHGMGFLPKKAQPKEKLTNSPLSPTDYYPENAPLAGSSDGVKWLWVGAISVLVGGILVVRYREYGA